MDDMFQLNSLFVKSPVVKFSSVAQLCLTPCDIKDCSTPGFPVYHQLPKLAQNMSLESVMSSNNLILCCPLLLLPSILPSITIFFNESALHQVARSIGLSASESVLPMNTQDGSPLGWTGWIFLRYKGLSRVFSNTTV